MNINTQVSSILTNVPSPASASLATAVSNGTGSDFAQKLDRALGGKSTAASDKKLKSVCQDMESVFLNMMLTSMRATVPKDSLLGESNEDDIMKSMLDTELSKNMAQAGGVGIASLLYRQLSPQQSLTKK
ncbi:flagellar protein FlgJ [Sporomusaceae bacterium BoRhaA]|jgi:peptidoglycan hydrolase FlgJ|uniref:rod-binding protein n=1 Tax=Pelorhabdus rhamnosifermentans TaxID=2772457 RepID=UPI001C06215F|nr:rod-binding protein [Pelorhabdus rhamnosifermentans]MBU2698958.1 flagellar protein FlgJ [Pelorhabdus rhamnosifermentans]